MIFYGILRHHTPSHHLIVVQLIQLSVRHGGEHVIVNKRYQMTLNNEGKMEESSGKSCNMESRSRSCEDKIKQEGRGKGGWNDEVRNYKHKSEVVFAKANENHNLKGGGRKDEETLRIGGDATVKDEASITGEYWSTRDHIWQKSHINAPFWPQNQAHSAQPCFLARIANSVSGDTLRRLRYHRT